MLELLGSTPVVYYTEKRVHPQVGYDRPGWLRCEQFGAGMITGWGVGIEAFASPICDHAMKPPLITSSGFTPKNAGCQRTRSASFPTSTDPTSFAMPCVIAGLMVYFAT